MATRRNVQKFLNGHGAMDLQIKHNRKKEFEEVALVHMNALYNSAVYLTGNRSDASDLVQETFLRAYKNYHLFEKGTNCRAWLFKIMQNLFRNRLRSLKREPFKVEPRNDEDEKLSLENILKSNLDSPLEELETKNVEESIHAAISKLPKKLRMAVILADLEELSYQEIAEILGVPIGTVRSRIARGRTALQKLLSRHAKDLGYI